MPEIAQPDGRLQIWAGPKQVWCSSSTSAYRKKPEAGDSPLPAQPT